jgi:peptidoglycan/LPS O-acetylase OafA/YrhL
VRAWRSEPLGTFILSAEQRPSGRSFLLDLLKAGACLLIVLHHLAFYGPMSDVVFLAWPRLINELYDHGRLAVQVFLVCSGFLTAASLQKKPNLDWRQALPMVWRRYLRLVIPYLAALSATVLVSEWVRPEFDFASLSATPDWGQALAHVFLMEHLLGMESLSAGVWYVAIDFQLYLIVLGTLLLVNRLVAHKDSLRTHRVLWRVWLVLTLLSLIRWSLEDDLDIYGLYFFGAYGLGLLAFRARQSRIPFKGWVILSLMGLLALWVDPRWRVTTAWGVALLLAAAPTRWSVVPAVPRLWQRGVQGLSRISYSVFMIHYAISLIVSAVVTAFWPDSVLANAVGMLMAVLGAVLAGSVLYRLAEKSPQDWRHWGLAVGLFMASVALAMKMSG